MTDERRSRASDYRTARIGMAVGITVAIVLMLLIDALSTSYAVDPMVLTVLGTLLAGLVAVDLPDIIRPGGSK